MIKASNKQTGKTVVNDSEICEGVKREDEPCNINLALPLQHSDIHVMHNHVAKALTLSLLIGGGLQVQVC